MALRDRAALVQARTLLRLDGRTVTYIRCGAQGVETDRATLTAARGESSHTEESDEGVFRRVKSVDWLFKVSDFVAAFGAGVEPADDDEIVYDSRRYLVKPAGGDKSAVKQMNELVYRCHTRDYGAA